MLWLKEHAGEHLAKHLVGHDGQTAFERLVGKPSRGDGYEFNEQVFSVLARATSADASAPGGAPECGWGAAGAWPFTLWRRAHMKVGRRG
eukprot:13283928-Alexandrium_andersonii.AAC.1